MTEIMASNHVIVRIPTELAHRVRELAMSKQSTIPKQVEYLLRKALEMEKNSE